MQSRAYKRLCQSIRPVSDRMIGYDVFFTKLRCEPRCWGLETMVYSLVHGGLYRNLGSTNLHLGLKDEFNLCLSVGKGRMCPQVAACMHCAIVSWIQTNSSAKDLCSGLVFPSDGQPPQKKKVKGVSPLEGVQTVAEGCAIDIALNLVLI